MHGEPASRNLQLIMRSSRKYGFAVRVAGCFAAVIVATVFVGLAPEANLIWVANGVLLAYLLLAPRRRWPVYISAAFAAQFCGGLLVGHHGIVSGLLLTLLNVAESLISAMLLRRRSSDLPDFTSPAYITRFLAFGVFAGPAIAGAADTFFSPLWHTASELIYTNSHGAKFLEWVAADALGACVATPAFVAVFRSRFRNSLFSFKHWAYLLSVLACCVVVFCQTRLPLPFLLYPVLVLVLLRVGLGWAAMSTLVVAGVASFFTVHGQGAFAAPAHGSALESDVLLQLFLAGAIVLLYSISVVLESLRATERRLKEVAALHKLVTENSRDVIIIADFEGNRTYVSCSASNWGGFRSDEMLGSKSKDLVHPEDRPRVADAVKRLRAGADGALVECRVKGHDGSYIWTEASMRTIRDPITGVPLGILNNARDISERKLAEEARQRQRSLIDAIHEVSLDGILVVDEEQRVVSCNQRFGELWKLDLPESLPGYLEKNLRLPDQFLLVQSQQSLKDPEGFLNRVQYLYENPDEKDHCEIQMKDGRTIERYSTCLRNKDAQYLGRVWFFRDITEHKLAERQLAEAYRAVERLAITDALTGLANRRHFEQCLANEWRRGLRERQPISLLLIDADLFKTYNDTYGHLRGDNCLQQIADAARQVVARSGDLVARFGGEEFAVILPNTGSSGALEMAHEVCRVTRERQILHSINPLGVVTVSVGCATLVPQLGQAAVRLVDCADKALYQAKRAGRNQACKYEAGDAPDAGNGPLIAMKSA